MAEKEEVVLEFKVEQGDAINELERTKKSILGVKQEQQELNKAYKAGNITLDEYVQDSVRLESILKKQQSSYNTLQKSVTGVKTQLDKLIESNKKISKSFEDAANQINVAGVNVGQVTSNLKSFSNPALAAVGIASALGAAYARSTIGAKDLAFAQSQLSIVTTLVTNQFAAMVSSADDGEGAVTRLLNSSLKFIEKAPVFFAFRKAIGLFGIDIEEIRKKSKELALDQEALEDIQREEVNLRSDANERLSENQELLTEIQAEQTKYNEKLDKAAQIIENIRKTQVLLTNSKLNELAIINKQIESDGEREELTDKRNKILKEISGIEKDAEKRIQNVNRLTQNLAEAEAKRLRDIRDALASVNQQVSLTGRALPQQTGVVNKTKPETTIADGTVAKLDEQKFLASATKDLNADMQKALKNTADAYGETARAATESANAQVLALQGISQALSDVASIFEENTTAYKILASADAVVNTYKAANLALSTYPPPLSYVAAGATVAAGLANVARINGVSFAAGGGDFLTKGPTALVVGDNPGGVERVTVEPISGKGQTKVYGPNLVAMAGGGSITTNPGGLISNSLGADVNQQLMMANMFKMMPAQVIGLEQFNRANDKLIKKQFAVRI
jgi:hypothetical protein